MGPLPMLRQMLVKESKHKLMELYKTAIGRFGGIPDNTIPEDPGQLANNWEDCIQMYKTIPQDLQNDYEVYKSSVRMPPLLISTALKLNAPPDLNGSTHTVDITEQPVSTLIGIKYDF